MLPKQHFFHGILLAYLFAYSFRLTPDQWAHTESFYPQNKTQTEFIESDIPAYGCFIVSGKNRFAADRDDRQLNRCTVSGFAVMHSPSYVVIPVLSRNFCYILTSADRIISFLHRATSLASSSDDDPLS